ncbi:MAG: alpha/beta hydrolase domain-containing protein [Acidobacteria bacterium]|nr:alpha/beta hydrolase domain-containing protein [Acidobacteriota bacterium]
MLRFAAALLLVCLWIPCAFSRVVRVAVDNRETLLNGKAFGLAGPYEKISGTVTFAADPANAANLIIADIALAPRNSRGEVEFSSSYYLLKPLDAARGNGALLYEVSNRGNKGMLSFFNLAQGSLDPSEAAHFGDGFLLEEGFTLLWLGWQWDTPRDEGKLRLEPPAAIDGGKPIRGLVRADFAVTDRVYDHLLSDRLHVPYEVADPDAAGTVLTVRDRVDSPRREIPRTDWQFGRMENGKVVADPGRVYLKGGFEPHKIYEVVYTSQNPPLVGLGPAAVRDMVSHLKFEGSKPLSIAPDAIGRALGFGISQSGRFLRTFLYYGFNEDEKHRKVFDGVIAHVAGGGRGSFNHRFAQASRDAHPFMNFFYPTDIFPFSDVAQSDPETGLKDGLLTHHLKREFWPKIFYTNSSYEYWGRAASLIHTTLDGNEDISLYDNVRIYMFAGTQHGPSGFPPKATIGQQLSNPMDFRWSMRALLKAMDRWASAGDEPPASRYPLRTEHMLLRPEDLQFPKIPGVGFSSRVHKAYRADYGPEFYTRGIVSKEPPEIGKEFPVLVGAVDSDGNEISGVRMPEQQVPLATYTGWNLFNAKSGPADEISSMQGSYIPFARTAAERNANEDPRPAIGERYQSRAHYTGLVADTAIRMIEDRYLLGKDLPGILQRAGRHWDYLMTSGTAPSEGR